MELALEDIKIKIKTILQEYGVKKAGIFGSYARGEMNKGSDIDILIELMEEKSLFDFIAIKLKIEEILGIKVDLVEYSSIHPRMQKEILAEQVPIL